MTASIDMLRRLGSGVRPGAIGTPHPLSAPGKTPTEGQSFQELLRAAKSASFRSEPVRLASGSKIDLDADQLRRLGPAADAAEADGATKLLAFIDGRGVVVDVASRTVEKTAEPGSGVVNGVDAVVVIPDEPGPPEPAPVKASDPKSLAATPAPAPAPSRAVHLPSTESIRNASVAHLLASLNSAA